MAGLDDLHNHAALLKLAQDVVKLAKGYGDYLTLEENTEEFGKNVISLLESKGVNFDES